MSKVVLGASTGMVLVSAAAASAYAADAMERADTLQEIVVTAERRTETLQNLPVSASVFDSSALEKAKVMEAKDYLQFTPNITFTEDGQVGPRGIQIAIRGVGNINISDNPQQASIGYYIDDLNVGAVAGGTINPQLQDVERVEVLRGPQGTYFGRNALGGAINIATKKPDAKPYFEVGAGYGSFDTYDLRGVANLPILDNLFLRVVAAYEDSAGIIKNVNPSGARNSGYTDKHVRVALRYVPTDRLTIDLSTTYTKEDAGLDATVPSGVVDLDTKQTLGQPDMQGFSQGLDFYPQNQRWVNHNSPEYNRNKVEITNGRINYAGDGFAVTSITGYLYSENGRLFDQDLLSADLFRRINNWHTSSFSEELRVQSNGTSPFQWTIGGIYARDYYYQFNDIFVGNDIAYTDPATGVTTQFLPPFVHFGFPLNENNTELTTRSTAGFAEGSYDFTDKWTVTLGARFTRDQVSNRNFGVLAFNHPVPDASGARDFTDFAPRLVLKYRVTPNVSTYATVSTGYRAGGVDINNGVTTAFQPEKLRNYEIGVKSNLADNHLRINASLFYLDWKDLQVQTDYLSNPNDISSSVQKTLNASSADSKGIELEVQALPVRGLELGFGGGYLDAHFKSFRDAVVHGGASADLSGQPLPKAAKWSLSSNGQYTMPLTASASVQGFVRLEGVYRSSVAGNLDATAAPLIGLPSFPYQEPSYAVFNLRLGTTTDHLRIEAYAENLFDRSYYNGTFDHFGLGGIRLRPHPRVFGARFTYKSM
ncbi:MAG: TonB-dependent receptor [Proteobacteria bacterium]|nr:TonB-dependent receptor [Pseudomonadota bacterium]